ncbi:MAG: DUF503 domain-containing protein [Candidatus Zixiibacteriota bacterium]|nr:MAG: DUF503 domain-containing protein [candidate division Zixibacteria bacterium]
MIVGTAVIDLNLSGVNSLKEKRRILKPLLARLQNRFNISLAEVDRNDNLRRAQLGVAVVSNDKVYVDQVIAKIVRIIDSVPEINLIDYRVEIL